MKTQKTKSAFFSSLVFRFNFLKISIYWLIDSLFSSNLAFLLCMAFLSLPAVIFANIGFIGIVGFLGFLPLINYLIEKTTKL